MNRDKILTFVTDMVHFGFPNGLHINRIRKKSNGEVDLHLKQLPHPVFLRCGTSDLETFDQTFKAKEFNFGNLLPSSPRTIIDAGANIGMSSIYFANQFPTAQIIAIEPQTDNYMQLVKNTKPYPKIKPIQCAVWPSKTTLQINNTNQGNWGFTVSESNSGLVEALPIPDILSKFSIEEVDLLKIDIEGAEFELFSSNENLSWIQHVDTIAIELHDNLRSGSSKPFIQALLANNYNMHIKGEKIVAIKIKAD